MDKNANFLHGDNENWSYCTDARADLKFLWAHMSECTFSNVAAQMIKRIQVSNKTVSEMENNTYARYARNVI